MQVFLVCIVLASFTLGSVITVAIDKEKLHDFSSQVFVPFINGAFQHNLDIAKRTSRQLDPTVTETKIATVVVACAKIVNVTGSCRRRRGHWEEDPIVLTFEEETDKLTEVLFTPVYSIEATELPKMIVNDHVDSSVIRGSNTTVDDGRLASSMPLLLDPYVPFQPRIYFKPLFHFLGKIISAFLPIQKPSSSSTTQSSQSTASTQTTTTSTTISTSLYPQSDAAVPQIIITTVEYWITITTTNTFFVQHCTPSPFPFLECRSSRRYSQVPIH